MGAGVSFQAGMPLADQVAPLVWHALDENPQVLERVAGMVTKQFGPAKALVGSDSQLIRRAFSAIGDDTLARTTFQGSFAALNAERCQAASAAHTALARLSEVRTPGVSHREREPTGFGYGAPGDLPQLFISVLDRSRGVARTIRLHALNSRS